MSEASRVRVLLSLFALLILVLLLGSARSSSWQWPSKRISYHPDNKDSRSSAQEACQRIPWEGEEIGTFCVSISQGPDQPILNKITLDNDFMLRSGWALETAYLWMGPFEVLDLSTPNYENVPYDRINVDQSTVLQFANVSATSHLALDCSRPTSAYVSKAVAILGQNSAQTIRKLEVEVSFELTCKKANEEGSRSDQILLQPADKQPARKLRFQRASTANGGSALQRRMTLLPKPDYDDNGMPSLAWLNATRNNACSAETRNSLVRSASNLLDETFLRKAYITNYLTWPLNYDRKLIANLEKYQQVYEHFYAWEDGVDDVTFIAKIEGTCYVSFRATDPFNLNDGVVQNLDCCYKQILDSNCFIREGYYNAYFTNYVADFQEKLDSCLASCEGGQCEFVITGGSQGAGPATVASIVHKNLNPTVITWGGARALYRISPVDNTVCQDVNPHNHWRMVLTDRLGLIDYIPYQWAFFAEHVGHEIFFDSSELSYMGINKRVQRNPLRYQLVVHAPCNYLWKGRDLYQNACFPVPSRGWIDDHWCAVDEDCESNLCYGGKCSRGKEVGESCDKDNECLSGSCQPNVGQCAPPGGKMTEGMDCDVDDDCDTGRCDPASWVPFLQETCQKQLDTGEECNEDSDCKFGYCGGLLWSRQCWPDDESESP